jgi:hypothetical protein
MTDGTGKSETPDSPEELEGGEAIVASKDTIEALAAALKPDTGSQIVIQKTTSMSGHCLRLNSYSSLRPQPKSFSSYF